MIGSGALLPVRRKTRAMPGKRGMAQRIAHQALPTKIGERAEGAGGGAEHPRTEGDDPQRVVAEKIHQRPISASASWARTPTRPPKVSLRLSSVKTSVTGPDSMARTLSSSTESKYSGTVWRS